MICRYITHKRILEQPENNNTRRKNTAGHWSFYRRITNLQIIEDISIEQLNEDLSEFIISVRKKENNGEYEPSSLPSMFASLKRYLKKKNRFNVIMDKGFECVEKLCNQNR